MELKQRFLREVAGGQDNMWKAGQALGLERGETESLALELAGEGLVEIVSLSGKLRLTPEGQKQVGQPGPEVGGLELAEVLERIRQELPLGLGGQELGDVEVDLNCLELQLKRSKPLKPVVSACIKALRHALETSGEPRALELARALVEAGS